MDTAHPWIQPKQAIDAAFVLFEQFMGSRERILLEGLHLDQGLNQWAVTIGFDSEREVPGKPDISLLAAGMTFNRLPHHEKHREFRTFFLSASDGSFVKMTNS